MKAWSFVMFCATQSVTAVLVTFQSGEAWLLMFSPCPFILLPDIYAVWVRSHESVEFHVEIFNTQQVYIVFLGIFPNNKDICCWLWQFEIFWLWSLMFNWNMQLDKTGKNFTPLHSNETKSFAFPNSISAYLTNCGENIANTVTTAEVFLLYMYV